MADACPNLRFSRRIPLGDIEFPREAFGLDSGGYGMMVGPVEGLPRKLAMTLIEQAVELLKLTSDHLPIAKAPEPQRMFAFSRI
jgi:hypothetical protein